MSARFHLPDVVTHQLASRHVDQTFEIKVALPVAAIGANERFPVLYVSEANLTFEVARIVSFAMQAASELERYIVVGIGYPYPTPLASGILRGRDLTPPNFPDIPGLPHASAFTGVPGLPESRERRNGGGDFLNFLRHELIPLIDATYPTIGTARGFFGHSLGARFALHALFAGGGVFDRILASSPGLNWNDNEHGLAEAKAFMAHVTHLNARVFISAGELEEFEPHLQQSRIVSSVLRFAAFLSNAGISGLESALRVFPGETHASVWPVAFSHGVRFLYGAPAASLLGAPTWMQSPTDGSERE